MPGIATLPAEIGGVVFDLDGTLVDSYTAIGESLNAARAGFDLDPLPVDQIRYCVGRGLEQLIAELVGEGRIESGVRLFRERYAQIFLDTTVLLPDASDVVRRLADRGCRLSVASNKPARFCREILANFGLETAFDTILGPDVTGATKPDPRMIHACLEAMSCPADRAVYVGDMPLDIESAERAGVAVVLVATGSATRSTLVGKGKTVIDRLGQLPSLLQIHRDDPH